MMPDPSLYRRWSTRELAAEYLREKIFSNQYQAGARIPQEEIATELGISRVPVREALVTLEAEGYLSMNLNRGASVNAITEADIRDQFELRGYALGIAARRAAGTDNERLIADLGPIKARVHDSTDADEVHDLMSRFYSAISRAGGSTRQRSALARFGNFVPGNFYALVPGSIQVARALVADELSAQEARNPAKALKAALSGSVRHGDLLLDTMMATATLSTAVPREETV